MILSGLEIKNQLNKKIWIEPFNEKQIGPNSCNLRLHNKLFVYDNHILDMKVKNDIKEFQIPEEGFLLDPGTLYLGRTYEKTFTDSYVPMLEGRSSIGRLGLSIHITAGFGDVGFNGYWTLEISCVQPVIIYPLIEICQIYYHTIEGDFELYKSNKYQNNNEVQPSMLYKDFK